VNANEFVGDSVSFPVDRRLALKFFACISSANRSFPPTDDVTATVTVTLTWTHPARPIS
jgi:hypothetical protein